MPTRNRRRFVGQAIRYFLRQNYPRIELVVVDDGEDGIDDLIPGDRGDRVRYVRLERRRSIGAKRNLGCSVGRGELIAHWDDDDWMAPDRLSRQAAELEAAGADVCGVRELLYYWPEAGQAWLYAASESPRPWVAGGTLLYRKSAWEARPFPEVDVGEDAAFVAGFPADRVHAMADASFYVGLIHPANTAAKNLADPRWRRRSLDEVSQLLTPDRDFYASIRGGGTRRPAPAPAPRSGVTPITVAAPLMVYDGYGSMAEFLVLGLERAGASVRVAPLGYDPAGMTAELREIVARPNPSIDGPLLYFCWPRSDLDPLLDVPELYINTMWESSRLPASWPAALNRARALIVPTRFVARVFRDSGINAPIEVIPEGIDPNVYRFEDRPDRPGLTTLIVGTAVGRKHLTEGVAAWHAAFDGDPEARLLIKSRWKYADFADDDARIEFVDSCEPTRGIAHWYRRADVLLALGSEGFGLPMVEGMATGLPVIALDSEGQSDACEEARDLVLAVPPGRWEPCNDPPFGPCGFRGVPGVADVAAKLRWVAEHRDEARDLGRAASDWARSNREIWAKGPAVLEAIERHSPGGRPLRRRDTLWVPSRDTPCGIAEYAKDLAGALSSIRVEAVSPDPSSIRVLHVQHEPSLFRGETLAEDLRLFARRGVPIAVTEHAVMAEPFAWEADASALVSPRRRGAEILRGRWPTKRVEHIPIGCPPWQMARKPTRGRVIGAFGFLWPHKGFWRLLDVLRASPGTELILYSHARSPEMERRWEKASAGLPVRRVAAYLSPEEVAEGLAAEADLLAFWYDEVPQVSASAAVCLGLSTGVPVLTSPTSWFEDLRDVTYQPDDLAGGIERLFEDDPLRERLVVAARAYCHEHRRSSIADRHQALWRSLDPP